METTRGERWYKRAHLFLFVPCVLLNFFPDLLRYHIVHNCILFHRELFQYVLVTFLLTCFVIALFTASQIKNMDFFTVSCPGRNSNKALMLRIHIVNNL